MEVTRELMIYTEDRDYWKARGFHKHIKLLITFDTLPTVHLISAATNSQLYMKRVIFGKSEYKINGFLTIFFKYQA